MKSAIKSAKLTKRLLFSAAEGMFLVSNVGDSPWQPLFAQLVAPADQREAQWQEIIACRANHRLCYMFRSPQDYLDSTATVSYPPQLN